MVALIGLRHALPHLPSTDGLDGSGKPRESPNGESQTGGSRVDHVAVGFGVCVFVEMAGRLLPAIVNPSLLAFPWVVVLWSMLASGPKTQTVRGSPLPWLGASALPIAGGLLVLSHVASGSVRTPLLVPLTACLLAAYLERQRPGLVKDILAVASLPVLAYAVIQLLGLDWNLWSVPVGRVHAGVGTANHLASLTVLVSAAVMTRSDRLTTTWRTVVGILCLVVLAATQSRSGVLVLGGLLAAFFGQSFYLRPSNVASRFAAALAIVGLAAVASLLVFSNLSDRFTPQVLFSDGSLLTRADLLRNVLGQVSPIEWLAGTFDHPGSFSTTVDNMLLDLLRFRGLLGTALIVCAALILARAVPSRHWTWSAHDARIKPLWVVGAFVAASGLHGLTPLHETLLAILVGTAVTSRGPIPGTWKRSLRAPLLFTILGATVVLGAILLIVPQIVPFRPPDSPGLFPYPDPSPLPSFTGVNLAILMSPAPIAWGVVAAYALATAVSLRHASSGK